MNMMLLSLRCPFGALLLATLLLVASSSGGNAVISVARSTNLATNTKERKLQMCSICAGVRNAPMAYPDRLLPFFPQDIGMLSCSAADNILSSSTAANYGTICSAIRTFSSFVDIATLCGCFNYTTPPNQCAVCSVSSGNIVRQNNFTVPLMNGATFTCEQGKKVASYIKNTFACAVYTTAFNVACCSSTNDTLAPVSPSASTLSPSTSAPASPTTGGAAIPTAAPSSSPSSLSCRSICPAGTTMNGGSNLFLLAPGNKNFTCQEVQDMLPNRFVCDILSKTQGVVDVAAMCGCINTQTSSPLVTPSVCTSFCPGDVGASDGGASTTSSLLSSSLINNQNLINGTMYTCEKANLLNPYFLKQSVCPAVSDRIVQACCNTSKNTTTTTTTTTANNTNSSSPSAEDNGSTTTSDASTITRRTMSGGAAVVVPLLFMTRWFL